jgi:KipI family sensor histidine kinase inhibitor
VTVRAAGDRALLVEAGPAPGAAARVRALIQDQKFAGVVDVIPGAETVLVVLSPGAVGLRELAGRLADADFGEKKGPDGGGEPDSAVTEIPVLYDGPDLAEVAEHTGLSRQEVIERHAAAEYRVGWLGFSPGFGYLTGLDPALHVPRRDSPRTSVPAGSVAIAGPLAAVYPAASPGGWRLLGRTAARLWDVHREPPAVLAPGRRVRFRPVAELGDAGDLFPAGSRARDDEPEPAAGRVIEVVRPGALALVADLGRPGYGHLGVPRSGAADPDQLRLANRLVGNPEDAAGLELTLGGAELRFSGPVGGGADGAIGVGGGSGAGAHGETGGGAVWVAVTGAAVAVRLDRGVGRGLGDDSELIGADHSGMGVPFAVPAGATLSVGVPTAGVRSYLAVRGGIAVPAVLGSRSCDTLSGLGPAPLRAGDRLPVGDSAGLGPIAADLAPRAACGGPHALGRCPGSGAGGGSGGEPVELRVVAGPRDDWFRPEAVERLRSGVYEVTSDGNRSGLRLAGPELPRSRAGELPSEGMPLGALQVPPSGQPILFLADHPVTGGYPVIAVVTADGIGRAAQLRPGDRVRFRLVPSPLS